MQIGGCGTDDHGSLLSTIWYTNTIHLRLRWSHEHRQLKWEDITLETDRNEIILERETYLNMKQDRTHKKNQSICS